MQIGSDYRHHWGVILAGGEGARLRSLTRLVSGDDTPKQFCPLLGGRTLLAQTKQRIARSVSPDRTAYVLLSSHERFYREELQRVSPMQMIVQPGNRGTLPAIICSLIRIIRQDIDAVVGFFPSDHHYTEEEKFMSGVELAYRAAETNPESVMLLGVAAKHAETDYGWIEAEPTISTRSNNGFLKVKRFWEKPSARTAAELLDRGCVWNTFVMVGRAQAFLDLIRSASPAIYREFEPLMDATTEPRHAMWDTAVLSAVYERLTSSDFSKLVLSAVSDKLGVWCLGDVGWNDLGDPRRVVKTLAESGMKDDWMALWQERCAAVTAGS